MQLNITVNGCCLIGAKKKKKG